MAQLRNLPFDRLIHELDRMADAANVQQFIDDAQPGMSALIRSKAA